MAIASLHICNTDFSGVTSLSSMGGCWNDVCESHKHRMRTVTPRAAINADFKSLARDGYCNAPAMLTIPLLWLTRTHDWA